MDQLPALCLCLLICSGAAFSLQTGSKVTRKIVREDEDALLECALDGRNIKEEIFDWKKDGRIEVFYYKKGSHYSNGLLGQDADFKDRVSYFDEQLAVGNASIVIRKAQVKDSGNYSCKFPFHKPERRAQYELIVGAAQKPYFAVNKTNDGMLLRCEVERAFPKPRVEWWDAAGNVLPGEPTFTKKDDSFDVFLQTTVTESGFYRCVATQEEIHSQVFAETYVSVPGAASEPSVTNLKQTKDWALLQCLVKGVSPKPSVFWQDDSGNIINSEEPKETERGGSCDIVLQTTVTKTDYYHCVVTQDDIKHNVSNNIKVIFGDSTGSGLIITASVLGTFFVCVAFVAVLFAVLRHKGYINCNKGSQTPTSRSLNSPQLQDEQLKEALAV